MTSKNNKIPCMLCGKLLKVRQSKSDKPYFICNICGLQTFIRFEPGIKKLKKLLTELIEKPSNFITAHKHTLEVLSLMNNIKELEGQLQDLHDNKSLSDYLFQNNDRVKVIKQFEKTIKNNYKILRNLQNSN